MALKTVGGATQVRREARGAKYTTSFVATCCRFASRETLRAKISRMELLALPVAVTQSRFLSSPVVKDGFGVEAVPTRPPALLVEALDRLGEVPVHNVPNAVKVDPLRCAKRVEWEVVLLVLRMT